jgi:hypothetical protein
MPKKISYTSFSLFESALSVRKKNQDEIVNSIESSMITSQVVEDPKYKEISEGLEKFLIGKKVSYYPTKEDSDNGTNQKTMTIREVYFGCYDPNIKDIYSLDSDTGNTLILSETEDMVKTEKVFVTVLSGNVAVGKSVNVPVGKTKVPTKTLTLYSPEYLKWFTKDYSQNQKKKQEEEKGRQEERKQKEEKESTGIYFLPEEKLKYQGEEWKNLYSLKKQPEFPGGSQSFKSFFDAQMENSKCNTSGEFMGICFISSSGKVEIKNLEDKTPECLLEIWKNCPRFIPGMDQSGWFTRSWSVIELSSGKSLSPDEAKKILSSNKKIKIEEPTKKEEPNGAAQPEPISSNPVPGIPTPVQYAESFSDELDVYDEFKKMGDDWRKLCFYNEVNSSEPLSYVYSPKIYEAIQSQPIVKEWISYKIPKSSPVKKADPTDF